MTIQNWILNLTWQDWITIISLIIGAAGLFVSIWSVFKAKNLDEQLKKLKAEWLSRTKYNMHRTNYIKALDRILCKLNSDKIARYSSGDIKKMFSEYNEIVYYLSECTDHLKSKHKQDILECLEYISKIKPRIYSRSDCDKLFNYVIKILNVLKQEDYFL